MDGRGVLCKRCGRSINHQTDPEASCRLFINKQPLTSNYQLLLDVEQQERFKASTALTSWTDIIRIFQDYVIEKKYFDQMESWCVYSGTCPGVLQLSCVSSGDLLISFVNVLWEALSADNKRRRWNWIWSVCKPFGIMSLNMWVIMLLHM